MLQRDEPALLELVWSLHNQPQALATLENELRQEALYDERLHRLLEQRLRDCWLIAFKYQQPRELLAAFEYDYLVRQTEPREQRSELLTLLQKAHDVALCLRYYGQYGLVYWADRQLTGARLFAEMKPADRVETLLCAPSDECLSFEDALLNPPRKRIGEWTCFHVKMRRTAFLAMQLLLRNLDDLGVDASFEVRGALIDAALLLANHWRTLMWRDLEDRLVPLSKMSQQPSSSFSLERVKRFFALPREFREALATLGLASPDFNAVIEALWVRVEQEIPVPSARIFLQCFEDPLYDPVCLVPPDQYDFLYNYDGASSQSFRERVLAQ